MKRNKNWQSPAPLNLDQPQLFELPQGTPLLVHTKPRPQAFKNCKNEISRAIIEDLTESSSAQNHPVRPAVPQSGGHDDMEAVIARANPEISEILAKFVGRRRADGVAIDGSLGVLSSKAQPKIDPSAYPS